VQAAGKKRKNPANTRECAAVLRVILSRVIAKKTEIPFRFYRSTVARKLAQRCGRQKQCSIYGAA